MLIYEAYKKICFKKLKERIKMCGELHEKSHDCVCSKFCGIVKLVMAGIVIGSAAGMVLMYFYDRDKWLQCKARKMVKDVQNTVQNTAQNIQSGIKSTIGLGEKDD